MVMGDGMYDMYERTASRINDYCRRTGKNRVYVIAEKIEQGKLLIQHFDREVRATIITPKTESDGLMYEKGYLFVPMGRWYMYPKLYDNHVRPALMNGMESIAIGR